MSEDMPITGVCKCVLRPCQKCKERACITLLKVLESSFSVLKRFILEYKIVEAICVKLQKEAQITVSPSDFETENSECQFMVFSQCISEIQQAS